MKEIMWNIRNIRFITIDEVYDDRKRFRNEVLMLDQDTLEIYKWYFYHQLCMLSHKRQFLKDLMWEYLVSKDVDFELSRQYRLYSSTKSKKRINKGVQNTQC